MNEVEETSIIPKIPLKYVMEKGETIYLPQA